jgi:hypothetical protein
VRPRTFGTESGVGQGIEEKAFPNSTMDNYNSGEKENTNINNNISEIASQKFVRPETAGKPQTQHNAL